MIDTIAPFRHTHKLISWIDGAELSQEPSQVGQGVPVPNAAEGVQHLFDSRQIPVAQESDENFDRASRGSAADDRSPQV